MFCGGVIGIFAVNLSAMAKACDTNENQTLNYHLTRVKRALRVSDTATALLLCVTGVIGCVPHPDKSLRNTSRHDQIPHCADRI